MQNLSIYKGSGQCTKVILAALIAFVVATNKAKEFSTAYRITHLAGPEVVAHYPAGSHKLAHMFARGLLLCLLVAAPSWSFAQSALEQTVFHFGAARDSLLIGQGQLEAERSMLLSEMRELDCDSTWLWHLAERSMVLRVELRASLDTLLARNTAQLALDPHAPLYMDLSAQDAGKRIHAQFITIYSELLLICPDAQCRQELEAQARTLFGGLSPESWGIHSFYRVLPFALEPVLLSYITRTETMVNTVIRSLHNSCLLLRN